MELVLGNRIVDLKKPVEFPLEDIATALSWQFRFAGNSPITVAQHSVLVSQLCSEYPAEALMHDAAEALIGDIPAPLKKYFVSSIEEEILERIFAQYGLRWPVPQKVKEVDKLLNDVERGEFFEGQGSFRWLPLKSAEAREQFLERAKEVLC